MKEWISWGVIAAAIIGGAVWVGELKGQIDGLQKQIDQLSPDAIAAAEEAATNRLVALAKGPTLIETTYAWRQGQQEVEMIGIDEGFCYLTRITGRFEGDGEFVVIHIRGGSWYLDGGSLQEYVAAKARCWKWTAR